MCYLYGKWEYNLSFGPLLGGTMGSGITTCPLFRGCPPLGGTMGSTTCPLFRGCPLLRGTMGSNLSFVQRLSSSWRYYGKWDCNLSFVQRLSSSWRYYGKWVITTCPLFRGCPLLGGTMGSGGCPLFRVSTIIFCTFPPSF